MKKVIAIYALLLVSAFVLNGIITEASNQDSFWTAAAQSGMAEVMLGNLALQKSQNEQTRDFAQKMVADHTTANDELKALAAAKNVQLPTAISSEQQRAVTDLSAKSGADFDKSFMKQMVADHEAAVKLFENQAANGDDAEVKAFAAKTLPTLRSHLQMARKLEGSTDKSTNAPNTNTVPDGNRNVNSEPNRNVNAVRPRTMNAPENRPSSLN